MVTGIELRILAVGNEALVNDYEMLSPGFVWSKKDNDETLNLTLNGSPDRTSKFGVSFTYSLQEEYQYSIRDIEDIIDILEERADVSIS